MEKDEEDNKDDSLETYLRFSIHNPSYSFTYIYATYSSIIDPDL